MKQPGTLFLSFSCVALGNRARASCVLGPAFPTEPCPVPSWHFLQRDCPREGDWFQHKISVLHVALAVTLRESPQRPPATLEGRSYSNDEWLLGPWHGGLLARTGATLDSLSHPVLRGWQGPQGRFLTVGRTAHPAVDHPWATVAFFCSALLGRAAASKLVTHSRSSSGNSSLVPRSPF